MTAGTCNSKNNKSNSKSRNNDECKATTEATGNHLVADWRLFIATYRKVRDEWVAKCAMNGAPWRLWRAVCREARAG
jgi:hypothetical protein